MRSLENLGLKVIRNGRQRTVRSFSSHRCEPKRLFEYALPPLPEKNGSFKVGAKEVWLSKMEFIKCDLEWLLDLPHHEFWSNMIFKEDRVNMLVSFLKYAHPRYMLDEFPKDNEMFDMYSSVHYLVLCVFKRLSTIKETERQFLSVRKFAELIYEYYVFSIPRLMDICLLYGKEYRSEVTEIVTTVLEAEPKFLDIDLDEVIETTLKSMRFMQGIFIPSSELNADKLVKKENDLPKETNLPLKELKVVTTTLVDLFETLHYFMDIYPSVCKHFHQHSFELRLASFYAAVIPKISYNLEMISNKNDTPVVCEDIKSLLAAARGYMLETYHHILSWRLNSAIKAGQENRCNFADDYTAVLIESLTETVFIKDYHSNFPIDQDLDILSQMSPEIEESSRYLLEVVSRNFDVPVYKLRKFLELHKKAKREKAEKAAFDKAFLEVKEFLPHLEDAFIQKCLYEYQNDSHLVIRAVINNILPKYLQKLYDQKKNVLPIKVKKNVPHLDSDDLNAVHRNDVDSTNILEGERKSKPKGMVARLHEMYSDPRLQDRGLFFTLGLADFVFDDNYYYTYGYLAGESEKEEKPPEKPEDAFVYNPEESRARRNQWYGDWRPENLVDRRKRRAEENNVRRNQDKKNVHKPQRGSYFNGEGDRWRRYYD